MFEAIKKHIEIKDRFAALLNMTVLEADHGYGKISMPFTDELKNPMNALHGGAIFSVADVAFGVAANYGEETVMITTSSSISFIKGAKSGPIVAEARRVNGSKRMATFDVKVFDGEGTVIASALLIGFRIDAKLGV